MVCWLRFFNRSVKNDASDQPSCYMCQSPGQWPGSPHPRNKCFQPQKVAAMCRPGETQESQRKKIRRRSQRPWTTRFRRLPVKSILNNSFIHFNRPGWYNQRIVACWVSTLQQPHHKPQSSCQAIQSADKKLEAAKDLDMSQFGHLGNGVFVVVCWTISIHMAMVYPCRIKRYPMLVI